MSDINAGWAKTFFNGRRVLVTGGTSGIGLAIASDFAAAGAEVLATGATPAEVQSAPQVAGVGFEVLDVRDMGAVEKLTTKQAGLDVLVNCAGVNRRREEYDAGRFAEVLDINLTGTMRVCMAARPHFGPGSAILNIGSMYSFFGAAHAPAYAASKGGVAQLTKSLALEFAGAGIRVNALAPGWIETPMTAPLLADQVRSETIVARTAMRRWGKPTDLSGAALFLCSPLADFITGVVLPVDGGYMVG